MLREVVLALTLAAPPSVALHIQVGGGAGVPAVDRGAVWVPNTNDGTISRVGSGGAVVTTIKLGAGTTVQRLPRLGRGRGRKVWVARDGAAEIDQIDPAADRVTKRVRVALRPGGLTAGGGYVWAFHFLGPEVTRIDQTTGVKKVFTVAGLAGSGIVYAGGAVWVVYFGFDRTPEARPGKRRGTRAGGASAPATPKHGIIDAWWVAAGAGSLWVAETNYDRVAPRHRQGCAAIPVPVVAPFGVALLPRRGLGGGLGKVTRIDPATNRAGDTLTLEPGSSPVFTQLAAGPSGLWATDYDQGVLYRLRVP